MLHLTSPVSELPGIGQAKARAFANLGVESCGDLLSFFPRAYDDRTTCKPIPLLMDGESACVRAMVASEPTLSHVRRGMDLVKLRAVDDGGVLDITFFNQSYIRSALRPGETYVFYGRVERRLARPSMVNPVFEKDGQDGRVTGCIVPLYRLTHGLSQKVIINCARTVLSECGDEIRDLLPLSVTARIQLAGARFAYENIHSPRDYESLAAARRRLIFEELFVLACALGILRGGRADKAGVAIAQPDFWEFFASLPFRPTEAQERATGEAAADMSSGAVMNRLVQGDVGSGKTLVAAACIWDVWKSGRQSAFMAPTEILAEQHFATLTGFLSPFGVRLAKLTGSMTAARKRDVKEALAAGDIDLVIGTHALLTGDVEFRDLALVITDEQHRFGVEQRAALAGKGASPHILVMSATPIPRTLALIIYGDLDVSIIDELPPGRQRVDTFAVGESYRARLNVFISRLVGEGRQVFVVCPKIEETEEDAPSGLKNAEEHAEVLRKAFPELSVGCIHGRLKPKEKDALMARFVAGEIDILVSTTVIEVGVDVPNAALMIIENAERFGLSQLHQLRGRVGRGEHKSYCVLVSDAENEEARARLKIMTQTTDGFRISEEDLRLRGPGDFFGSRQHGLPEMHIADLGADMQVLKTAQDEAARLLSDDPSLARAENAALRERALSLIAATGERFN